MLDEDVIVLDNKPHKFCSDTYTNEYRMLKMPESKHILFVHVFAGHGVQVQGQ